MGLVRERKATLAKRDALGASIYNFYIGLSQLASIYVLATQNDHRENSGRRWDELSEYMLTDIGMLYQIWSTMQAEKGSSVPVLDDDATLATIEHFCHRVEDIAGSLDTWTLISRWPKAVGFCERRTKKILELFIERDKAYTEEYSRMLHACEARLELLEKMEKCKMEKWKMRLPCTCGKSHSPHSPKTILPQQSAVRKKSRPEVKEYFQHTSEASIY